MKCIRYWDVVFWEAVYQEALAIEFKKREIVYEREAKLLIDYKGITLQKYYIADFLCYNKIVIELKALTELTSEHESQLLNELKASGYKVGLLANFGGKSLQIKRRVWTK